MLNVMLRWPLEMNRSIAAYSEKELICGKRNFDYPVFQGIGQARRQYREDLNDDGDITDAGAGTPRVEPLPQSTGQREDSLLVSGIEQQIVMRWMSLTGFDNFDVTNIYVRASHSMPDGADGNLAGAIGTCVGQEVGLTDLDGGGYRTPSGEVFWQIKQTANYTGWGYPGTWQSYPSGSECFNDEAYEPRPDQNTDNNSDGNPIENGDLPSGW